MGEKAINILAAVVTLAVIAVIFKSGKTSGIISSFGGAFSKVIRSASAG